MGGLWLNLPLAAQEVSFTFLCLLRVLWRIFLVFTISIGEIFSSIFSVLVRPEFWLLYLQIRTGFYNFCLTHLQPSPMYLRGLYVKYHIYQLESYLPHKTGCVNHRRRYWCIPSRNIRMWIFYVKNCKRRRNAFNVCTSKECLFTHVMSGGSVDKYTCRWENKTAIWDDRVNFDFDKRYINIITHHVIFNEGQVILKSVLPKNGITK